MLCLFFSIIFAIFAWLLTWVMVALLFYPKKQIQILGYHWEAPVLQWVKSFDWQQFLPQNYIAKQLDQLMPIMDSKLDDFFKNSLPNKLPMVSMFIGDKTILQLKEVFKEEMQQMYPELLQAVSSNIQHSFYQQLEQKTIKLMEKAFLQAIAPIRKVAFAFGIAWGCICYLIWTIF